MTRDSQQRRQSSARTGTANRGRIQSDGWRRVFGFWGAAIVVAIALSPISGDDVWWEASRGRAVLEGAWAPSRVLLVAESNTEADWLGGVPVYLAFHLAGTSGWMLMKLAACSATAVTSWRRTRPAGQTATVWLTLLVCLAATDGFEPSQLMWDVLALIALDAVLNRWLIRPSRLTTGALIGLFLVWANVARLPALGVLYLILVVTRAVPATGLASGVASAPGPNWPVSGPGADATRLAEGREHGARTTWLFRGSVVAACVCACCLTPRWWLTLWDSVRLLSPTLAEQAAVLQQTEAWKPLWFSEWGPPECAFSVLTAWSLTLVLFRATRWRTAWLLLVGHLLVWTCRGNLAPGAVWCGLTLQKLLTDFAVTARRCEEDVEHVSNVLDFSRKSGTLESCPTNNSQLQSVAASGDCEQRANATPVARRWGAFLAGVLAASVLLSVAAGWWPNATRRCGWGLSPHHDPAPLQRALDNVRLRGSAHCDGIRAAGLLCWLRPNEVTVFDCPHRALLGQRLREHVLLNDDLGHGRAYSYRRSDGSWGGWWKPIQERQTALLLISAERSEMLQALAQGDETIWRPLSLQSTVVPFGRAGDPACSREIITALQFGEYLNWRAAAAAPLSSAGSDTHWDVWGRLTNRPDVRQTLREVGMLRALQWHSAALKLLAPALRPDVEARTWRPSQKSLAELNLCQAGLADEERRQIGRPSCYRQQGCQAARISQPWPPAVDSYRAACPDVAAAAHTAADLAAETTYGRAWIHLESGRLDVAAFEFRRLLSQSPGHRLAIITRRILSHVEPAGQS